MKWFYGLINSFLCGSLENNLDPDYYFDKSNYELHLVKAVENNKLDLVQRMINYGNYDLEEIRKIGKRLIVVATERSNFQMLEYLFTLHFDIHAWNDRPLLIAVENGDLEMVQFLVDHGANIHVDDEEPLHIAIKHGYLHIVKYLVENGSNVHIFNDYFMVSAIGNGHLDIVKFLIEQGLRIYNLGGMNDEALNIASRRGYTTIVKYLLPIVKKNKPGTFKIDLNYCLYMASYSGHIEVVKYLIEQGANCFESAFIIATRTGHLNIVIYLIDNKHICDINTISDYAKIADNCGQVHVALYLYNRGANLSLSWYPTLEKSINEYKRLKSVMDTCIERIYFDPRLERTKTEQLESFHDFQNELQK